MSPSMLVVTARYSKRAVAWPPVLRAAALLLLLAVATTACSRGGGRRGRLGRGAASPAPIPTAVAQTRTVKPLLSIAGVIAPLQNVGISSSLSEPADTVRVNEGDRVAKGQTLAVLDTTDLRANLEADVENIQAAIRNAASADAKVKQTEYQARLQIGQGSDQVTSARAAVAQAQQTLAQAQLDLGRDETLLRQGYVSQQTVDQQRTTVRNNAQTVAQAQASLQSAITNQQVNGNNQAGLQAANVAAARADAQAAHAQVDQARATADQVRAQIAKATIVAPTEGVVVNRNLNPGEYPGSRTIFTLQQIDRVYAMLNASSADVFKVSRRAPASVVVSGSSSRTYTGTVDAVLGQVTPGSTNFTVKVELANPDSHLVSGLPVTGTIALPQVSGVAIPSTAFLDDSHSTIIAPNDGVAEELHVRELASDGTNSIVSGLKLGQKIVANGQLGLTPGSQISER
jgi:HlyD family secretion protein